MKTAAHDKKPIVNAIVRVYPMQVAVLVIFAIAVAAGVHPAHAEQPTREVCIGLKNIDFSTIPDAPAQIIDMRLVAPSARNVGYCQASGYVAPNVGFLLRLPYENWNGKLLQLGCGAHCGSTDHVRKCDDGLSRGYACVVTDNGHKSASHQALWAYNNWQGQIDYFVRAAHVTALTSKAIVERYYGEAPRRSYFMGCSAGGREAMMEAQRFPWDFDGIIAGCPSLNQLGIRMNLLWSNRALTSSDGKPLLGLADIDMLHRAIVNRCDLNDGIKDGLIGDPRQCEFKPPELLCTVSKRGPCLTASQVDGIRKVYAGPTTKAGQQIYWPGALPGSERTWPTWFGAASNRAAYQFVQEAFRYYAFDPNPGTAWRIEDFDFDRDSKRLGLVQGLYSATNPDLRKFRAAGGKLLSYAGWNDAAGMPLPVIDYYEATAKLIGRAGTEEFFRLFVIPGMGHCAGGDGADLIDYLSYLEAWVERGEAPDKLIGFHVSMHDSESDSEPRFPPDPATVEFSRPVYPYPTRTRYLGHGNAKDASSFGPVDP